MNKNKYEFIADLLANAKIGSAQKERMISLIVGELKKDGANQLEIEARIRQIEMKLETQILTQEKQENIVDLPRLTDLPSYTDPAELTRFLTAYNQDPILKSTCHRFDQDLLKNINDICRRNDYDLEEHQKHLSSAFKRLSSQHKIPKNIWTLINAYINGGRDWSSDNIKTSWKDPELMNWSKDNPGIVPNPDDSIVAQTENLGFEFPPFKSIITQKQVKSFSELVIHFKNLFHIRSDNSLKKIIESVNNLEKWETLIDFSISDFNDRIEFFTDVDKLRQAYKRIINIILEVSIEGKCEKPRLTLSLIEAGEGVLFSIHHTNSIYKKTIKNTLERIGQSQTGLIKNQINGLCDLHIQADFGREEFAKINLWNGETRKAEVLEKFEGVEYQLIFK